VSPSAGAEASVEFEQVTVEDLSRHFGRRKALSKISFTTRAGSILGLLGPNGAGKSTLLAILATLLEPSAGSVRYGSHRAREAGAALRARIGLLGHDLYLYPELTARENLTFFAELYGARDGRAAADAALARAALSDRGDDQVSSFSRGMRQRVALERALVHTPRLLLLDALAGRDRRAGHTRPRRGRGALRPGRVPPRRAHGGADAGKRGAAQCVP
jgi:heme exporter protein A